MKRKNDNYARHIGEYTATRLADGREKRKYSVRPSGEYVFFAGAKRAVFSHPQHWAFFKLPPGEYAETFRGQLVGIYKESAAELN